MYRNYVYVSSTSPKFVKHFESFAEDVFEKITPKSNDLAIDIGSNDGILLRPMKQRGLRVLGIDPAEKIAAQATQDGIETLPVFFKKYSI